MAFAAEEIACPRAPSISLSRLDGPAARSRHGYVSGKLTRNPRPAARDRYRALGQGAAALRIRVIGPYTDPTGDATSPPACRACATNVFAVAESRVRAEARRAPRGDRDEAGEKSKGSRVFDSTGH